MAVTQPVDATLKGRCCCYPRKCVCVGGVHPIEVDTVLKNTELVLKG